eukprot:4809839-Prymnesium_polylepis.2
MPALLSALASIRSSASMCASRATPGTTPPHSSCSAACEPSASPRIVPSLRTMATPVSSQLVSIPSTVNGRSVGSACTAGRRKDASDGAVLSCTAFGLPTKLRSAILTSAKRAPPRRHDEPASAAARLAHSIAS